jgi:hypothetical protein
MERSNDDRLAAIVRELERQDAEWERAKEKLRALGDVEIAVPKAALEEIRTTQTVCAEDGIKLQGVRG